MKIEDLKKDRFLRRDECRALTGLKDTALEDSEARGDFPQRVRIGVRACGWLESEVLAWMASKIAARDAQKRKAA